MTLFIAKFLTSQMKTMQCIRNYNRWIQLNKFAWIKNEYRSLANPCWSLPSAQLVWKLFQTSRNVLPVGQCSNYLGQKPGQKRWHDVKMLILKKSFYGVFLNQFKWTYFIYEFHFFYFVWKVLFIVPEVRSFKLILIFSNF